MPVPSDKDVPVPADKDAKAEQGLPDPELNPLTNPLLAKNMGRWAEVYFTNPPERREEAVQQLLRELQDSETRSAEAARPRVMDSARQSAASDSVVTEQAAQVAGICPACLHRNRDDDRFCGLCGFPLRGTEAKCASDETGAIGEPNYTRTEEGWEWLRNREMATLQASTRSSGSFRQYAFAVLIAAACLLGLYFWWIRRPQPGAPATVSLPGVQSSANRDASSSQKTTGSDSASGTPVLPANKNEPSAEANRDVQPGAAGDAVEPAQPSSPAPSASVEDEDSGSGELTEGKRYLEGRGVPKNSKTASAWLWRAVAKQNPEAVLLLSDLYVRGDGVPQSCDQARVLLSAAAKRGSAAADQKLATLQSANCR